jgi:outer membrane immunogenic protein
MKKLLLLATVAAGIAGMSSTGQAADLPVKAMPPPPPPPFNWTGFYVGGNFGAAWGERTVRDNFFEFSRSTDAVFMGGGQIGFNYQINAFVLGVEWDFDAVAHNNNNRVGNGILINGLGPFAATNSSDRWISTLAARLGVANDHWLAYLKLGVGEVGVSNFTITNVTTGGFLGSGTSRTRTGGMIGFGAEYAFTNNWTMKAEYDLIQLSDRSFTVPAGAPFLVGDVFRNHNNVQTFKVGFNYLFGRSGY